MGRNLALAAGGGGGGAAADGAGTGGGGGAEDSGATGELALRGVAAWSSVADSGRGGAIVPKRMDAKCAALAPPGRSSSSSESSSSSLSEPQSSSSGRFLDTGADAATGAAFCVMRWKGLVDSAAGGGGGAGAAGAAGAAAGPALPDVSEDWDIIRKYGLRLSASAGGLATTCGTGGAGADGGDALFSIT